MLSWKSLVYIRCLILSQPTGTPCKPVYYRCRRLRLCTVSPLCAACLCHAFPFIVSFVLRRRNVFIFRYVGIGVLNQFFCHVFTLKSPPQSHPYILHSEGIVVNILLTGCTLYFHQFEEIWEWSLLQKFSEIKESLRLLLYLCFLFCTAFAYLIMIGKVVESYSSAKIANLARSDVYNRCHQPWLLSCHSDVMT
jgi:hypothetical protein